MFKIAVICGGPSLERGISLNSARSLLDHLSGDDLAIVPLYVDWDKNFYAISPSQLYSNTPADFDFKLAQTAGLLAEADLIQTLNGVDLVFPVIHGAFGENGELQALLEKWGIPFVGSSSKSCQNFFYKQKASQILQQNGFKTLPSAILQKDNAENDEVIASFFAKHGLKRAIVKPVGSGSSIGVYSVETPQQAQEKCQTIFQQGIDNQALLEPFCHGKEFTVVIFESFHGEPVALLPTEIEMSYAGHQIFDYRLKYLPTHQVTYHTPPRFDEEIIEAIRKQAQELFKIFKMRDFARIDGWLLEDGSLYFSDFNPISGLEQNSFLFRQASLLGLSHKQTLHYIVSQACKRWNLILPPLKAQLGQNSTPVYVFFGGKNAERQVSLMSGTNVWLKLLRSSKYAPHPFFYDASGCIWELPYSYALNHTVEEIYASCESQGPTGGHLTHSIQKALDIPAEAAPLPIKMSWESFLDKASQNRAFVFNALHGGEGEDGTLQRHLENYQIRYNGSDSNVSALCMDKYLTRQAIAKLGHPDILALPQKKLQFAAYEGFGSLDFVRFWQQTCFEMQSERLIIKPRRDGCSAGVALLISAEDFERYIRYVHQKAPFIPMNSFKNQQGPIEMPSILDGEYILEPYIETDEITVSKNTLSHKPKEGWIELTVGVFQHKAGYRALNPSITIAEGAVLSLEEKFQGGTGINLTPPPEEILSVSAVQKIKSLVEQTAQVLGIQNYARIDIFFNRVSRKLIVIEANTLPGLTPATVFYHQGLAENPPLFPTALLEHLIAAKLES